MAVKNNTPYTPQSEIERAISSCWPELKFRLGEQLGHGGMSDVYKLAVGGRIEAVKVTNSSCGEIAEQREDLCCRGYNELAYAKKMAKAGCGVKVFDTAEFALSDSDSSRRLYLIRMECLQSLPKYLEKIQESERTATVLVAMESTAQNIRKMEEKKALHRDIKEENILVKTNCTSTQFVLTDFGLARPNYLESKMDNFSISGTGSYRAPELLEGREISENKSDVYSLGVSLFSLLIEPHRTGRLNFDAVAFSHNIDQYTTVEEDIKELIVALTKREPKERLSPREAAAELHKVRLAYDKVLYTAEVKNALYTLRSGSDVTDLVDALPTGAAASLLAAAAALRHNDQNAARKALAQSSHPACCYYLAALVEQRQRKPLLERSARAGFAPARAALLGKRLPETTRVAELKAAMQL